MHWQRHRDGSFLRVLATSIVLAAALGALVAIAHGVRGAGAAFDRVAALPRGSLRAPAAGPAVYTGRLDGPPGRTSHYGDASAAHAGWITETTGSGKNRRTVRICGPTGEVDQLTFTSDDGVTVPLAVSPGPRWSDLYESGALEYDDPRATVLDLGPVRTFHGVPVAIQQVCAGYPVTSGELAYYDVNAPPHAPVTVVGCFDGAQLGPCADGGELVAVRDLSRVERGWTTSAMNPVRYLGVLAAVLLAILGFATLRHLVRLDRAASRAARRSG